MNTKLRSIGLAAFGAAALTIVGVQDTRQADICATGHIATTHECNFETLVWQLVERSADESDVEAYIDMFPNGRYLKPAKERRTELLPTYGVVRGRDNPHSCIAGRLSRRLGYPFFG